MKKVYKYLNIMKITLQNDLVYFWDYLSKNIFFLFIMFVYWMLWKTIFMAKGNEINGFTLNTMIWYLVATELVTLSRPNLHFQISEDVKSGAIAYLLNKPYHYIAYYFSVFSGGLVLKLVTNAVAGLTIGLLLVGPLINLKATSLFFVALSIILGCILNFTIYMILALSAFWFEENQSFFWIYSKLVFTLGGMLIPLDLFPEWLSKISKYLPFTYVTYAPAKLAVAFTYEAFLTSFFIQVAYCLFFLALAVFIYRKGAKELNVQGG